MRSIIVSWGSYGGFYISRVYGLRICLGWVALTVTPVEIDAVFRVTTDLYEAVRSRDVEAGWAAIDRYQALMQPPRERWRCVLFGHVGNAYDSGYHICTYCGLHEYHHSRLVDPTLTADYDHTGVLLRPWWRLADWAARVWQARPWRTDDPELPF